MSWHFHHSPLNSNERKELLVGEVPTGEQLFYLSFDEFREWGVVVESFIFQMHLGKLAACPHMAAS